ncbi:MAG: integrase family protein [Candidatus Obscuribacterales bacterium]|nr:integrase family protein [Candidatus Obscuribacterales bacterium]
MSHTSRITESLIGDIRKPDRGQKFFRDSDLKGFGLRVTPRCISYIVECRVDGKTRRVTIGNHDDISAQQARKEAKRFLAEMAENKHPTAESNAITLREVADDFFEVRKVKPNTARSYRGLLQRCVSDWLDMPVTKITYEMVQTRHKELTKTTRQGTGGEYQANSAIRLVGGLLNFAMDNYETQAGLPILLANPVRKLTKNRGWHKERRRRNVIQDCKLRSWYLAVKDLTKHRVRDFLLFILLTGLRKNEAATLQWKDVDLEDRSILIRQEIAKNGEEHRLPLSEFLVVLLKQRKLHTLNSAYVFPGQSGQSHLIDCGDVVDRVIRESGCDFVLHDLRRTFISMAARLGLPRNIVKKLVNHIAGLDATDGYIVLQADDLREPMQRITDRFLLLMGCDLSDWQEEKSCISCAHICPCVKIMEPH